MPPGRGKGAWEDDEASPSSPSKNPSTSSGTTARRGSRLSFLGFGKKGPPQRVYEEEHRWDGLQNEIEPVPPPPGKIRTLVIPIIIAVASTVCLIMFFTQFPETEATKEGICRIIGYAQGSDCVDCRMTIEVNDKKTSQISNVEMQIRFRKSGDGTHVPENDAFRCCPRRDRSCCGWFDPTHGKFCDVQPVPGSVDAGCDLGPWPCRFAEGPNEQPFNITYGNSIDVFLMLICGLCLLALVPIIWYWNRMTYQRYVAVTHQNMRIHSDKEEAIRAKAEEAQAKKKRAAQEAMNNKFRRTLTHGSTSEWDPDSPTKSPKSGKEPQSPWTAPARTSKGKGFSPESPSPKKSKKNSESIERERLQTNRSVPNLSDPSKSSLADRRGRELSSLSQARDGGFKKAPTLDSASPGTPKDRILSPQTAPARGSRKSRNKGEEKGFAV